MASQATTRPLAWPHRLALGLIVAVAAVLLMAAVGAQSGERNCDAPGPACDRALADFEAEQDRETAVFGAAGGALMALVVIVLVIRSRRTSQLRSSARS